MKFEYHLIFLVLAVTIDTSISTDSPGSDTSTDALIHLPVNHTARPTEDPSRSASNQPQVILVYDSSSFNATLYSTIKSDIKSIFNETTSIIKFYRPNTDTLIEKANQTVLNQTIGSIETKEPNNRIEVKCINTLSGIVKGLNNCSHGSTMIVFTNNRPQDEEHQLLPSILSQILEKRIRVFFILTKTYGELDLYGPYNDYRQISYMSNGLIFVSSVEAGNGTTEILKFTLAPLKSKYNLVHLLSLENMQLKKNETANEIYVDETISEIFISVFTHEHSLRMSINLTDPEGEICNCSSLIDFSGFFKSCRLQNPRTGLWRISVQNPTECSYSLKVSALSSEKIFFGFDNYKSDWVAVQKSRNSSQIYCQPQKGSTNFFVDFNSTNSMQKISLSTIKIISSNGTELKSLGTPHQVPDNDLFVCKFDYDEFNNSAFHLQFTGQINGTVFQRITPVAYGYSSNNYTSESRNCELPGFSKLPWPNSTAGPSTTVRPTPHPPQAKMPPHYILWVAFLVMALLVGLLFLIYCCGKKGSFYPSKNSEGQENGAHVDTYEDKNVNGDGICADV